MTDAARCVRRASHPTAVLGIIFPSNDRVHDGQTTSQRRLTKRICVAEPAPGPTHVLPIPAWLDCDHVGLALCMLKNVSSWNFDMFLFNRLTHGNALACLVSHLFHMHGLLKYFHLDPMKLRKFLVLVQADYHRRNPYHNSVHAADVTQAIHCYISEAKLMRIMRPQEVMLGLLAAAVHDIDHPGVNLTYLRNTGHYLARVQRGSSVLENHHWRSTLARLRESEIFDHLVVAERHELEACLQSLILATDISRQSEFLSRFQLLMEHGALDMTDAAQRHLILQISLKCADISNPCRPWHVSHRWGEKVCEEFFRQGDLERRSRMPISSLCDRYTDTIPTIQIGFMTHLAMPLFEAWAQFMDTHLSRSLLSNLVRNRHRWQQLQHSWSGGGNGCQQDSITPRSWHNTFLVRW
uniref:high affinity 3',5'-cyclic-AMP phosphodiesterase 7A-like n=1 Tax=Myxine glutinosa TaxID=7769 RepID=UPI00358E9F8D